MIMLRSDENIHLVKRKHKLTLIRDLAPIALIFLATIIGIFVIFFISFSFPETLTESFPVLLDYKAPVFLIYLLSLLLLFTWQIMFIVFTDYYLDCWIITDQRTIHTEINGLFNRTLSSVPHDKVQDITVSVSGVIPTFLKYGDLQIQTAGKFQEFVFKQIPEPYKTKELIFKVKKDYLKKRHQEKYSS